MRFDADNKAMLVMSQFKINASLMVMLLVFNLKYKPIAASNHY